MRIFCGIVKRFEIIISDSGSKCHLEIYIIFIITQKMSSVKINLGTQISFQDES